MANLQVGVAGNGTVTVGAGASVHSPASNELTLGTNNAERLRITGIGSVGIGTLAPHEALHVYHATANGVAQFESGDATTWIGFRDSTSTYPNLPNIGCVGDDFRYKSGGTERLRIDSSGNIGIGTDNPGVKLDVRGVVNIETDDNNAFNIIDNSASFRPSINFKKNDSGTVSTLMQVRAEGTDGLDIKDGSGNRRVRITSAGKVSIIEGDSGLSAPNAHADTLYLENSGNAGVTIATPNTNTGYLTFADPEDDNIGQIIYRHNGNSMGFFVNADERLRITSDGFIGIGTLGNDSPTAALSFKTGSNGHYIIDMMGTSTKQFGFYYDQGSWDEGIFRIDEFDNSGTASSRMQISAGGKISMGTAAIASPLVGPGGLDISARGADGTCSLCVGADHASTNSQNRADNDQKDCRIGMPHYTNAEQPVATLIGFSGPNGNDVRLGGGTGYLNTATDLRFYTEETTTTAGDADKYRVRIHNKGLYELRAADGSSTSRGWRQSFAHKSWDTDAAAALFDLHMVGGFGSVQLWFELRDSSSSGAGGAGVRIGTLWVTFRGSGNDITTVNCSQNNEQYISTGTLAQVTWSAAVQDTSTIRLTATPDADSSSLSVYLWGSSPHFAEGNYGIEAV